MDPYNVVNRAIAGKSDLKLLQGQVIAVHGRMLTVKLYDGIANHVPVIVSGIPKPGDVVWLLSDKGKLLCISPSSGALSLEMLDSRYVNPETLNAVVSSAVSNRVLRTGDSMSGPLQIDSTQGIVLHSPGVSVVTARAVSDGAKFCWSMRSGWEGDAAILSPIECADPVGNQFAATQGWARSKYENPMLSGPHGPLSLYEPITAATGASTLFSLSLHHTCVVPGLSRVSISGYSQIRNVNSHSRASLTAFIYPVGFWHDGQPFAFTNEDTYEAQARHTETKKTGITSGDYGYQSFTLSAWFVNRPGVRCSLGMQANTDYPPDGGASAQFGHMRISVMVYPNASFDADDSPTWAGPRVFE